jgi:hypothetical protein
MVGEGIRTTGLLIPNRGTALLPGFAPRMVKILERSERAKSYDRFWLWRTRKNWLQLLAYVRGSINQELLLRNEYLAAENHILNCAGA